MAEVTIVYSAYLLDCSHSHAGQHAVLGELGEYAED